ncbi:MAG: hypothetical protein CL758_01445 [Chloroflexi bacterium]|nr:hypothetical protein [Chloroflexota bacterium]|tara:strand:+ start:12844 stop:14235 length:1392 start_codon:yes stop_codon:yes gene_type:complete
MKNEIELIAHLYRRAGFGENRDNLDKIAEDSYESIVEKLLNPGERDSLPDDLIRRYHVDQSEMRLLNSATGNWIYRMVTTSNPLEEKITLFWHGLFATGFSKVFHGKTLSGQIDMLRGVGLGNFRDILLGISRDPAMLFWLDNNDNHADAINENYGRELLELFSMSIGNYTEKDVKECSRAFTGWTVQNIDYMGLRALSASIWPYSNIAWQYEYKKEDHDNTVKEFLGEKGNFNGEEVIDIIVKNPATAKFISTRLYQFFVSDSINNEGEALIDSMINSYFDSKYELKSVLRCLFNSDLFKSSKVKYAKVKSPIELIVGVLKLADEFKFPNMNIIDASRSVGYMGQQIYNPPSVEGWHEGVEWLDSGNLLERVNFASKYLSGTDKNCVQGVFNKLDGRNSDTSPQNLLDECLSQLGYIKLDKATEQNLINNGFAKNINNHEEIKNTISNTIRSVVSSREFQLA